MPERDLATTNTKGLLPKLSGAATDFLGGTGLWSVPPSSLDIHGLSAETGVASGDEVPIYDVSEGANNKATIANIAAAVASVMGMTIPPSGVYTPTLTNVANLDSSTAYQCQYMRVGSVVTVSGQLDLNPTLTATTTQLGISLPIASDFGNAFECGGVAFAPSIAAMGAAIYADSTNNRAQLQFKSTDLNDNTMLFTFTYLVI